MPTTMAEIISKMTITPACLLLSSFLGSRCPLKLTQQLCPFAISRSKALDASENVTQQLCRSYGAPPALAVSFSINNLPKLSSNRSTRACRVRMVLSASLAAQISVGDESASEMEEGATPQSSAAVVLGVARGVPGEECVWKEGGGEVGMERMEGA